MRQHYFTLLFIIGILTAPVFANKEPQETTPHTNKGKIYGFWGWNRGWYTNSDIHFKGNNYDFTLYDVAAKDRPSPFSTKTYFNPNYISIPQTNYGFGYFVSDKYDISIAVDHMKYVVVEDQQVDIEGTINDETNYDGTYTDESIVLVQNFLLYEHTDGLNYIRAEITRNDDLLKMFKLNVSTEKLQINTLLGVGLGAVMPKSNVKLWHNQRHDAFHFAGYGFAAKTGLNATFFKHFFIRTEYKIGYINMPDVRTTYDPSDRADQHFSFAQWNFCFGFTFRLLN